MYTQNCISSQHSLGVERKRRPLAQPRSRSRCALVSKATTNNPRESKGAWLPCLEASSSPSSVNQESLQMPPTSELHPDTFLHAVLDSVGVALLVIDSEGRFVFTNQAAHQMFGSAGSVDRRSVVEVMRNYVVRDSQGRPIPPEQSRILRALAGEEVPPERVEMTLPDGRTKWLHVAGHQFSVFGTTGIFVIITDETEQVELRLALERAQRAEELG